MSVSPLNPARRESLAPMPRRLAARAYRFALPFVGLIVALLIFPGPLTPLGMVGVLLLLALRWLAFGSPLPKTRLNPLLLVFLVMFAFGLAISPAPDTAWSVASHTLAGILIFVTILDRANNTATLTASIGVVVLVGALFAFGAPFGAKWSGAEGFDLRELTARYVSLLARPSNVNNVAGTLEAAVPLALALIAANQKPWRLVGTLALAPLLVMLLLLQSRGAWLGVLMGLVVYVTLYRRWVLPLVPIVLLAALWLNNTIGDPVPTRALEGDPNQVVTLADRTAIWQDAVRLLVRSPLTGIGVNGFSVYGAPILGNGSSEYELHGSHAHNLFLQITLDTGIIGGAAFLGMLALAFWCAWQVYRYAESGSVPRALAIGVLAAFVVITTHGMFDTIFWGFKGGIFLWAVPALALALGKQEDSLNAG